MDVVHFREILHPSWDPTHHPHQLDHCELTIVLLEDREKNIQKGYWVIIIIFALIDKNENSWWVNISEKMPNDLLTKNSRVDRLRIFITSCLNLSISSCLNELHICVIFWCIIQTACSLVNKSQIKVTWMPEVYNTDADKTKFREQMSMCHGPRL